MLAIGCLIPLVLIVAGAAIGSAIGGRHGAIIAAVTGGVIGAATMVAMAWAWERIRSKRI